MDKDDNAFAELNNAASDEEDVIDETDNFYETILSDEWEWEELTPTTDIPAIPDHYISPHGLKPGVEKRFNTVLECIFETSGMDMDYFRHITAKSNKYVCSKLSGYNKFGGMKWTNISLKEMFQFYGIILRMSIEP